MPHTNSLSPERVEEAKLLFELYAKRNSKKKLSPITGNTTPKDLLKRAELDSTQLSKALPCADSTVRNSVTGLKPLALNPNLLRRLSILLAVPLETMLHIFDAQRAQHKTCTKEEKSLLEQLRSFAPLPQQTHQPEAPVRPVLTMEQLRRSADGNKITSLEKMDQIRFTSDKLGATFYAENLLDLDWARLNVLEQESSLALTSLQLKVEGLDLKLKDGADSFEVRCKLRDARDRADLQATWTRRFYHVAQRAVQLRRLYHDELKDVQLTA